METTNMRLILFSIELEGGLKPTVVVVDDNTWKLVVPDGLLLVRLL